MPKPRKVLQVGDRVFATRGKHEGCIGWIQQVHGADTRLPAYLVGGKPGTEYGKQSSGWYCRVRIISAKTFNGFRRKFKGMREGSIFDQIWTYLIEESRRPRR